MTLYDLLKDAQYTQPFTVYVSNNYDQNVLIGRGTRPEMLDEKETGGNVFDHLNDTVERFMQEARLTAQKILYGKENSIMNLVQQAWAEGKRSATTSYQEGAADVKRAVDKVLDIMSYDAKELFRVHNEKMAADMLRGMSLSDLFDAEKRIDEWVKEKVGEYKVGHVVRDPLGRACVITKIYTGDTAGVMGGFHVLYGDGDTNRWPLGTEFEPLWTDSGLFDDLIGGIKDADETDREEREE